MATEPLMEKIRSKKALVGVIGLGYVGLPLVREFTRGGARVVGFDVDQTKVDLLMAGKSYIEHIPSDLIKEMIGSGRFEPTTDFDRLREPDCILICVPTPLTKMREPDMTYIESTANAIAARLRKGQLLPLIDDRVAPQGQQQEHAQPSHMVYAVLTLPAGDCAGGIMV